MRSIIVFFSLIEVPVLFFVTWSSPQVKAFAPPSFAPRLDQETFRKSTIGNETGEWLKHGLLMSSFSDGLKPNPQAIDFLMRGLVASLWREQQSNAEKVVEESVLQSPCCGPDLDALTSMESADIALADLEEGRVPWQDVLNVLTERVSGPLEVRFLYIPTAMYAVRKDSSNSPGTQRQRARADGKKRRNEIVRLLSSQFEDKVCIRTVTLDLDDSSIKQPDGHDDILTFPKVSTYILVMLCVSRCGTLIRGFFRTGRKHFNHGNQILCMFKEVIPFGCIIA
jgi:hypothetical protein